MHTTSNSAAMIQQAAELAPLTATSLQKPVSEDRVGFLGLPNDNPQGYNDIYSLSDAAADIPDDSSNTPAVILETLHQDKGLQSNISKTDDRWTRHIWLSTIFIFGTLVLLLATAYISFIWFGDENLEAWKTVVLHNWVATSVAICAVLVRSVTTLQISFVVSLVALLTLRRGTPLKDIARISSLRYSNSGPYELLYLLLQSARLSIDPKVAFLAVTYTLLAFLLQFTSTLLISDLALAPVATFLRTTSVSVLPSQSTDDYVRDNFYTDPLRSPEPSYPLFAESIIHNSSTEFLRDQVDDTGPTIRALLPIPNQRDRARTRYFEGNATLWDARWICTRSTLSDLRLTGGSDKEMMLSGRINVTTPVAPMIQTANSTRFNCSIVSSTPKMKTALIITCTTTRSGLISALDAVYDPNIVHTEDPLGYVNFDTPSNDGSYSHYTWMYRLVGKSYIVFNISNVDPSRFVPDPLDVFPYDWTPETPGVSYDRHWNLTCGRNNFKSYDAHGPWTRLNISSCRLPYYLESTTEFANNSHLTQSTQGLIENWEGTIDVSLCANAAEIAKNFRVRASRTGRESEPITMDEGITQMIDSPQEQGDRAVLKLDPELLQEQLISERNITLQGNARQPSNSITHLFSVGWGMSCRATSTLDRMWAFMPTIPQKIFRVHESRIALFHRVLERTGSLALAMQTMHHTYTTDRYYRYLPYFTNESIYSITGSTDALQPVRVRGYIIVMVGLTCYLAMTIFVIFTFGVRMGDLSTVVGQAWQTYAQVFSLRHATDVPLFEEAGSQDDDTFSRTLEAAGIKNQIFVLGKNDGDDIDQSGYVFQRRLMTKADAEGEGESGSKTCHETP